MPTAAFSTVTQSTTSQTWTFAGQNLTNTWYAGPAARGVAFLDSNGQVPASQLGYVVLMPTAVKTANYAVLANQLVPTDATSGAIVHTLPTAPPDKTRVAVKKIDATTNTVTINAGGSDVFNIAAGAASLVLSLKFQAVTVQYTAATGIWYVVADDLPLSQLDARYVAFAFGTATSRASFSFDTAANWASANPVLNNHEQATETDTGVVKQGNGTTAYASLPVVLSGTYATLIAAISGWATGSAFILTGSQTYDATYGTLTGANIKWPDGATGVFASTGIDTTSTNPGGLTGFTASHVAGSTLTATVTIPRNSSGQVSGTMTVTVA